MWRDFTNSRFWPDRLSDTEFAQQSGLFLLWRPSLPEQRERFHLRRSLRQLYNAWRRRREWKEEKVVGGEWVRLRFWHVLSRCWSLFSQRTRRRRRFGDLIWFTLLPALLSDSSTATFCDIYWPGPQLACSRLSEVRREKKGRAREKRGMTQARKEGLSPLSFFPHSFSLVPKHREPGTG